MSENQLESEIRLSWKTKIVILLIYDINYKANLNCSMFVTLSDHMVVKEVVYCLSKLNQCNFVVNYYTGSSPDVMKIRGKAVREDYLEMFEYLKGSAKSQRTTPTRTLLQAINKQKIVSEREPNINNIPVITL